MALSNLLTRFWKPMAITGATVYGAYGAYEWKEAKQALHIEKKGESELSQLFDTIDTHKSGFIDIDELTQVLNKSGHRFRRADIKAMMALADEDQDGQLSKEEFIRICKTLNSTSATPTKEPTKSFAHTPNIADIAKIDTTALEAKYKASPDELAKKEREETHLTPSQLHDEIKFATSGKERESQR